MTWLELKSMLEVIGVGLYIALIVFILLVGLMCKVLDWWDDFKRAKVKK